MAIVRLPYRQEPFAQEHARPGAAEKLRLSVIIPVFNELAFIEELLLRVQDSMLAEEIIVVDDGSTDGTRQLLRGLQERKSKGDQVAEIGESGAPLQLERLRFLFQETNQGKGAALRRGFAEASGDIYLVQDADLEYDPKDYPRLLEPILDGRADVVFGMRLKSNRFGFEPEVTIKVAKGKWRIYEVPISYSGRSYEEGKKITWRDGVVTLFAILRYRLFD